MLLAPGTYNSITMVAGDMDVALVPPSGSHQPIQVIGQASEGLIETGTFASGPASSSAPGGPANAAAIASEVDPGLVDIDSTLSYEGEEAEGTGMVLASKGEVLTNNHVIDGGSSIRVVDVGNGKTYSASVVGYDRTADVLLLQLEHASGLQTGSVWQCLECSQKGKSSGRYRKRRGRRWHSQLRRRHRDCARSIHHGKRRC